MSQSGPLNIRDGTNTVTSATGTFPVLVDGVSGTPETGDITISVDPSVPIKFNGNTGSATPAANTLNVVGTGGTIVTASGDTLTIDSTAAVGVTSITGTAPLTMNGVSGSPQSGTVTAALTTPLAVQYGGTGISSLASGNVPAGNGTSPFSALAYSITSTASSLVQRDSNQNAFANSFTNKATNVVSAGGTTTLTAASARWQNLTGTLTQTFQLPDSTTLSIGARFDFNNNSTGLLTIKDGGGTTLFTVPSGGQGYSLLLVNVVSAGVWDYHFSIPSNTQWGTASLIVPSTTLISAGQFNLTGTGSGTISIIPQAAAGTFNFNLPITAGTSGYFLTSAGGGSSPMTWTNPATSLATSITGTAPITANGLSGSAQTGAVTIAANNATTTTVGVASFNSTNFAVSGAGAVTSNAITVTSGNNITATASWNLGGSASIAVAGTTNHAVQIGNATGSLTSIAIGTTGQVLTGNTGADPSWAALSGITVTSISGTANQINASASTGAVTLSLSSTIITPGTLSINGITAGSVLFSGASGLVSQNNSNFFWDNTNTRLGILTNSNNALSTFLQVGNGSFSTRSVYLAIDASNTVDKGIEWYSSGTARALMILPSGSPSFLQINNTGTQLIGMDLTNLTTMIGTGTAVNTLDVNGAVAIGSYAGVNTAPTSGLIVSGQVGIGTASVNATSTLHVLNSAVADAEIRLDSTAGGQGRFKIFAGTGSTNRATRIDFYNYVSSSTTPRWTLINDFNQNGTNDFRINNASSNVFTLLQTLKVGVNTTSPQNTFDVNGAVAIGSYAGVNTAPTSGLIVSGQVGIGTNSPTSTTQLHVSSTSAYGVYENGTQTAVDGTTNQACFYANGTLQPTNGSTISAAFYAAPVLITPSAKTMTVGAGLYVGLDTGSNVGVLSSLIGVYVGQGNLTVNGTISSAYGIFINQPLASATGNYYAASIQGGQVWHRTSTSTSETETTAKTIVAVTDTTAVRTITLPSTVPDSGWIIIVKDESGGAATHNITVSGNGHNIDGSASLTISTNYGVLRIYSNGTQYYTW